MNRYLVCSLLIMNGIQAQAGWCENIPGCQTVMDLLYGAWGKRADDKKPIVEDVDALVQPLEDVIKRREAAHAQSESIETEFAQARIAEHEVNVKEEQILNEKRKLLDARCVQGGDKSVCDEFVAVSAVLQQLLNHRHGSCPAGRELLRNRVEWRAELDRRVGSMQKHLEVMETIRSDARTKREVLEKQDDDIKARCAIQGEHCTKDYMFKIIVQIHENRMREAEAIIAHKKGLIADWQRIDCLIKKLNSRDDIEEYTNQYFWESTIKGEPAMVEPAKPESTTEQIEASGNTALAGNSGAEEKKTAEEKKNDEDSEPA